MRVNEEIRTEEEYDGWDSYTDEELQFLMYSVAIGCLMILIGKIAMLFN